VELGPNQHSLMRLLSKFVPPGATGLRVVEEVGLYALKPRTFALMAVISGGLTVMRASNAGVTNVWQTVAFTAISLSVLIPAALLGNILCRTLPPAKWAPAAATLWCGVVLIRFTVEILLANGVLSNSIDWSIMTLLFAILRTLAWVALFAGVQGINSMRRSTSKSLQESVEDLRQLNRQRWRQLNEERLRMARWIRRTVTPTLDQLSSLMTADSLQWRSPEFANLVEEIADSSREVVREASHRMKTLAQRAAILDESFDKDPHSIDHAAQQTTVFRARESLVVKQLRIEPGPAVLLVATLLLVSGPGLRLSTLVIDIAGALMAYLAFRVLAPLAEAFHRFTRTPRILGVLLGYLIGSLLAIATANVVVTGFVETGFAPDAPFFTSSTLWLVLVGSLIITTGASVLVSDGRVWREEEVRLNRNLTALDAFDRDMTQQYVKIRAQSAALLHGPVQGRLATIAMTLRFQQPPISRETIQTCQTILDECRKDLERVARSPLVDPASITQILESLRVQWQGLVDISWNVDDQTLTTLDRDKDCLRSLETMVADLVSNASRHGSARNIHITLSAGDTHIDVVARDDGRGPVGPVTLGAGLGESLISDVSITVDSDGWCVVTARHMSLPHALPAVPPQPADL
jgi:signal transduction histidine kinase